MRLFWYLSQCSGLAWSVPFFVPVYKVKISIVTCSIYIIQWTCQLLQDFFYQIFMDFSQWHVQSLQSNSFERKFFDSTMEHFTKYGVIKTIAAFKLLCTTHKRYISKQFLGSKYTLILGRSYVVCLVHYNLIVDYVSFILDFLKYFLLLLSSKQDFVTC